MTRYIGIRLLWACLLCASSLCAHARTQPSGVARTSAWQTVKQDYANFYSPNRLTHLGIAFAIGGVMANTHIDQGIRDWYQAHLRTSQSDQIAHDVKKLGNGYYTIPISLLAMGIGQLSANPHQSVVWQWGQKSLRAYLVGGPAMLLAQQVTGASRPQERPDASHWRPFKDSNGVSGHAFMGAIPFLTIADMAHNAWVKYGAYVASGFTGWSRINDDAHFASQVFLGWYMAYQATNAVTETDSPRHQHDSHLAVLPWPHGVMVAMHYQW